MKICSIEESKDIARKIINDDKSWVKMAKSEDYINIQIRDFMNMVYSYQYWHDLAMYYVKKNMKPFTFKEDK